MACALTQGYTLDCKDSLGGITEVYFMAFQQMEPGMMIAQVDILIP